MAEKLSAADKQRLKDALASWESWREGPQQLPEVVARLGGDSNLSFVISDGLSRWALRLNSPVTVVGVNRENERLALEASHLAGLSPLTTYSNSEMLVTPMIAGAQATLQDLSDIGGLFARIHALELELAPLDLLLHLRRYYEQAERDSLLDDCYGWIVELYPQESVELRPCHCDCLLPNLIRSTQGLQVVDWEYAAMTDPAFDLGVFCASYKIDEEAKGVLFAGYGMDDEGLRARVAYFEDYYRLIEVLWWGLRGRDMKGQLEVLVGKF